MKAYKGFDKNLKCRDFSYKDSETYTEDSAELCKNGFHACENPLDCFAYYSPNDSEYREVELESVSSERENDSKICGKKITIGAKMDLQSMIKIGVNFIFSKIDCTEDSKATNTGNRSAATNTGYSSAATNTGDRSAATNTGNRSAATNTGNRSAATNTGYSSAATNTGNSSAATNTGDRSAATNTGYSSAATNTGNSSAATNTGYSSAATNTGDSSAATNTGNSSAATNTGNSSAATNTGNSSAATVEGRESVAVVTGYDSAAKGALGCWIVLTERGYWNGDTYPILDIQAFKVDGKKIKENTFYKLINSKLKEVK